MSEGTRSVGNNVPPCAKGRRQCMVCQCSCCCCESLVSRRAAARQRTLSRVPFVAALLPYTWAERRAAVRLRTPPYACDNTGPSKPQGLVMIMEDLLSDHLSQWAVIAENGSAFTTAFPCFFLFKLRVLSLHAALVFASIVRVCKHDVAAQARSLRIARSSALAFVRLSLCDRRPLFVAFPACEVLFFASSASAFVSLDRLFEFAPVALAATRTRLRGASVWPWSDRAHRRTCIAG